MGRRREARRKRLEEWSGLLRLGEVQRTVPNQKGKTRGTLRLHTGGREG